MQDRSCVESIEHGPQIEQSHLGVQVDLEVWLPEVEESDEVVVDSPGSTFSVPNTPNELKLVTLPQT